MSLPYMRTLAAVAAIGVIVAGAGPAQAADPSGTVTLASGSSAFDLGYTPLAHTSRGTVFESDSGGAIIVSDSGSSSPFALASGYQTSACTDMFISAFPIDNDPLSWTNVATGQTGDAQIAPGRFLLGATPDGWLETEDGVNGSGTAVTNVHRIVAATGTDTTIASIPDTSDPTASPFLSSASYACDASGYAVTALGSTQSSIIVGSFSGGSSTLVSIADPSGFVDLAPVAVAGSTVVYGADVYDDNYQLLSSSTVRGTVGGSSATLDSAGVVTAAAIGTSSTAYSIVNLTSGQSTLYVRPVGGSAGKPTQPASWSPWLMWPNGSGFMVAAYGSPGGGIYTGTASAVATPPVWAPNGGSLAATGIALSAGRAVWADDRRTDSPLWSRTVTGTGTLVAGQESLLGTGVAMQGRYAVADGRRSAWADGTTDLLQVHDGSAVVPVSAQGLPVGMSGHRVLEAPDPETSVGTVIDLAAGVSMQAEDLTAIWGNRAVGIDPDTGTIVAQDLVSGARSTLLTPADAGVPDGGVFSELALQGDRLAWTWVLEGTSTTTFGLGWRNLRTGVQGQASRPDATVPISGPSVYGDDIAVTSVISALVFNASGSKILTVANADSAVLGPMGLGWVDHVSRQPKVSPLPDQHLVPRHEGNPIAPSPFVLSAGSWTGEWVFTEPLSSCTVDITDGVGGAVRTLACNPAYAGLGEAVVTWDGKASGGTTVAPGSYGWSVHAGDADGPAVGVDGVATAIAGTFQVLATPPAYQPLTPARLLDTRIGLGAPRQLVQSRSWVDLQVTGRGGVPASGVSAVVLNVTATSTTGSGFTTVFPTGSVRPTASSLNYVKGQTVANQVVAKLGAGGKVSLYTSVGAHLVADVAGYYPTGGGYTGLNPTRILDTRDGTGAAKAKVGAGKAVGLTVTGVAGVPSTAAAVVLNVTVTGPAWGGFITAYPGGSARPTTSNINFKKGQTIAGMVIAKVGAGGKVNLFSSATTDLVADVVGWVPAGADYTALNPARLLDTRYGTGAAKGAVAARHAVTLKVTGRGGVPAGAKAVMLNVTVTAPAWAGFVTVYPTGASRPTSSNLNFVRGDTIANSVVAKVSSSGYVTIYTTTTTQLVADVSGYWTS